MSRQAEPFDPPALSAFHDASLEEIHQGTEAKGLICLLALHTGLRKRIVMHYDDSWRVEGVDGSEKFSLPNGCTACTIEDGGCNHCHQDMYSCEDGEFQVKKNTKGVGREIPAFDSWMDYHRDESRPTELSKWLNHFFTANSTFGYNVDYMSSIVKQVAERRHDAIATNHLGEVERSLSNKIRIVPDVKCHDLRATFAQQCLRVGVDDEQLMDWAGWNSRQMIDRYRDGLNDPSGANTEKYAHGRDGESGMPPSEKLDRLRALGVIDEDENLSADELAQVVELLD